MRLLLGLVLLSLCGPAWAVEITTQADLATLPTGDGSGFYGEFWNTAELYPNLTNALNTIAGGDPTATFLSTGIDYPNGPSDDVHADGTIHTVATIQTYLGVDAGTLSPLSGLHRLAGSTFRYAGYLRISEADDLDALTAGIQVDFRLKSDDGSWLNIGGVEVLSIPNVHTFQGRNGSATFTSAGFYDIEVIHIERDGQIGVELYSSIGLAAGLGILPANSVFSVVPEPSFGLWALALGVFLLRSRRNPG